MNHTQHSRRLLLKSASEIEITNITKAMLYHDGEPFTTSTQIAKYFGIKHKNVLRKIREFYSFDDLISRRKIEPRKRVIRGQEYPYFELDADAFSFTCMSLTGKKAEAFRWLFIQAFKQATAEVIKAKVSIEVNQANTQWIEARTKGKDTRKELQDKIKEFCTYAEAQRGKPYPLCPYYNLITSTIYSCLGIDIPKGGKRPRDVYSGDIVEAIEYAELEVIELLDQVMTSKGTRKGIQHHIARRLKKYDEVA